jgi:tRNA(Phe) wybutosine-synthesizing methylase Tyw3
MAEASSEHVVVSEIPSNISEDADTGLEDEEKRRLRKQQKLEMKIAARARSKEKRKQNKQDLLKKAREERLTQESQDLKGATADFTPSVSSTFDADREEMIKQLSEIRSDKSRAGRVDEQILPFVGASPLLVALFLILLAQSNVSPLDTINNLKDAYTTSSCAGRTLVACTFRDASKNKKFNIAWVYITHEMADSMDAFASVEKFLAERTKPSAVASSAEVVASVEGDDDLGENTVDDDVGDEIWFKMEPVIVAIRVRTITRARHLLNLARTNGFKNSGIRSIGNDGTVMLTLVDTYKIEALVSKDSKLLVTQDYMNELVASANRKLLASRQRLEKFRQVLDQRS